MQRRKSPQNAAWDHTAVFYDVNGNKIGALDGFYELTLAELFRKLSRRAIEHAPFRVAYKIEIVRRDSDDRLP